MAWASIDDLAGFLGIPVNSRMVEALTFGDAWAKSKRPDLVAAEAAATTAPPYTEGTWQYEPWGGPPPSLGCARASGAAAAVDDVVTIYIHRTDWNSVYRDFTDLKAGIYLTVTDATGYAFTGYTSTVDDTAAEYVSVVLSVTSPASGGFAPGAMVTFSSTAVPSAWAPPETVRFAVLSYSGLLYRERSTPQGIAGYESDSGGFTDSTAYYRCLDMLGYRKPVAR